MKKQSSGAVKWLLIAVSVLFLAVMLVLPLVYVLVTAFRQGIQPFLAAVTDKYALKSVQLTIEATLFAVVLNTIFGLFAAWSITKFQFRGKKVISTLIDLPLTVSPIIAGLIFVLTYGRQSDLYPLLKSLDIRIIYAVPGIRHVSVYLTRDYSGADCGGNRGRRSRCADGRKGLDDFQQSDVPAYAVGAAVWHRLVHGSCNGRVWRRIRSFRTSKRQDQHDAAVH